MSIVRRRSSFAPAVLLLGAGCGELEPATRSLEQGVGRDRSALVSSRAAWFETQKLVAPSPRSDDSFGNRLALSEEAALVTLFIDGGERVYAFGRSAGGFSEAQELVVEGVVAASEYHFAVAISGDTAIVGTPSTDVAPDGAAYVFTREGTAWVPSQRLLPEDNDHSGDHFGAAVAIDGGIAVIGAPWSDAAYVFSRSEDGFTQVKKLIAGDAPPPPRLRTAFGAAVAIAGNTVVIGAPDYDDYDRETNTITLENRGAAYWFSAPDDLSGTWNESQLLASDGAWGDFFGASVAIDSKGVLVGAPAHPWASQAGALYAYVPNGSGWSEQRIAPGPSADDFGISLSLHGDTLVVGSPREQIAPGLMPGTARVYARSGAEWIERQMLLASDGETWEGFGHAVALSGDTMLVSAPWRTSGVVYVEKRLGAAGSSCVTGADCGLGHCVSGICCESTCDGACEECPSGTCTPVAAGRPGTPPCTRYLCDGEDGACPSSCSGTTDCAGTHYCADGECTPKAREGAACGGPEECASGHCVRGTCTGNLPDGTACSEGAACKSGHCVDGVCCDDSCGGQCEACDVPGSEGECSAVEGSPRGEREPCPGSHPVCASSCDGTTRDGCVYPPSATPCGGECTDSVEITSRCDGRGECVPRSPRSCEPFVCDGERSCKDSCSSNDDCGDGFVCWPDGTCDEPRRCVSAHESQAAGERARDCGRYRCNDGTGACWDRCTSVDQCNDDNICDGNRCIELPVAESAGCGCHAAGRSHHEVFWLWTVFGLTLFAQRRTSARPGNGRYR